jgi:hypothetical protein
MVCLHRIVHGEEITTFQGSIAPFRVLMVQVGRSASYMRTPFDGFSGLGAGGRESLERNVGVDSLPLVWVGLFSHPSASVSVLGKRGEGGYSSWGEEISMSQS